MSSPTHTFTLGLSLQRKIHFLLLMFHKKILHKKEKSCKKKMNWGKCLNVSSLKLTVYNLYKEYLVHVNAIFPWWWSTFTVKTHSYTWSCVAERLILLHLQASGLFQRNYQDHFPPVVTVSNYNSPHTIILTLGHIKCSVSALMFIGVIMTL